VAFSPDGQSVVTASRDKTARMWDVSTGRESGQFIRYTDGIVSAAFSPDGKTIATADDDQTARLWLSIQDLLALAQSLIQREPPIFTKEEQLDITYGGE